MAPWLLNINNINNLVCLMDLVPSSSTYRKYIENIPDLDMVIWRTFLVTCNKQKQLQLVKEVTVQLIWRQIKYLRNKSFT